MSSKHADFADRRSSPNVYTINVYLINYSNNISKYDCTNSRHYLIKTPFQVLS